jgi:Dihydrodipicolinate synthetase family
VQNATFERTPKHWLGAVGDRQGRVDAVKKLRLITALKTPYLPDGRVDLFAYDNLVEQQIAAGVEGLIVGAFRIPHSTCYSPFLTHSPPLTVWTQAVLRVRGTSCHGMSTSCSSRTPPTGSAAASL